MRAAWQRKFNTVTGVLLWLGGVAMIGGGLYVHNVPLTKAPYPLANVPSIDPAACVTTLNQLGYSAYRNNEKGEISVNDSAALPDAKTQDRFARASLAIQVCRLPLVTFCAGTACPGGTGATLRFTLGDGGGIRATGGAKALSGLKDLAAKAKGTKP